MQLLSLHPPFLNEYPKINLHSLCKNESVPERGITFNTEILGTKKMNNTKIHADLENESGPIVPGPAFIVF